MLLSAWCRNSLRIFFQRASFPATRLRCASVVEAHEESATTASSSSPASSAYTSTWSLASAWGQKLPPPSGIVFLGPLLCLHPKINNKPKIRMKYTNNYKHKCIVRFWFQVFPIEFKMSGLNTMSFWISFSFFSLSFVDITSVNFSVPLNLKWLLDIWLSNK